MPNSGHARGQNVDAAASTFIKYQILFTGECAAVRREMIPIRAKGCAQSGEKKDLLREKGRSPSGDKKVLLSDHF